MYTQEQFVDDLLARGDARFRNHFRREFTGRETFGSAHRSKEWHAEHRLDIHLTRRKAFRAAMRAAHAHVAETPLRPLEATRAWAAKLAEMVKTHDEWVASRRLRNLGRPKTVRV